jgi:hypothetical protein
VALRPTKIADDGVSNTRHLAVSATAEGLSPWHGRNGHAFKETR